MITNIDSLKDNECKLWFKGNTATVNAPKTITTNGDAKQILPFPGAGIAMFDGSSYLSVSNASDFNFGTGDFTIEFTIRLTQEGVYQGVFNTGYSQAGSIVLEFKNESSPRLYFHISGGTQYIESDGGIINIPHHYAMVRKSGIITLYRDGVSKVSVANTESISSYYNNVQIFTQWDGGYNAKGYLSEFRISDVARYTGQFIPPMHQLPNDSNTKLLLHFNTTGTTFTDYSPSAHTITPYGNATQICSPCGSGIAYFDGNGDFLTILNNSNFNFGSNSFTLEFCYYSLNTSETAVIFANNSTGGTGKGLLLQIISGVIRVYAGTGSNWDIISDISLGNVSNILNYYAVCKDGSTGRWYFFRNGSLLSDTLITTPIADGGASISIGGITSGLNIMGYLSEFRISNIARYTSDYTPSTQPFKPDPYTKLLLHMDGTTNAFYDASDAPGDNGFPILPDGVSITANGTFGYTILKDGQKCLSFNGTNNFIGISKHDAFNGITATGVYTILMWVYANLSAWAAQDYGLLNISQNNSSDNNRFILKTYNGTLVAKCQGGTAWDFSTTYVLPVKQWIHIAMVSDGSTKKIYINLTQYTVSSSAGGTITSTTYGFEIGWTTIGANNFFTPVMIRDLMLFKNALSLDQIALHAEDTFIN